MKKRNDTFAHAIVGFFIVALVTLLAYFTIVVSGVDLLAGHKRRQVRIVFDQVGGLKERDSVMFRGTKVGTVERIAVTPTNLVVTVSVNESVAFRRGCSASVSNLSMLGGNCLVLEEGTGEPIDPTKELLVGETPTDWMRDISRIAKNLRDLTSRIEIDGIVTNLEAASESVRTVLARIERGEGLVGRLVSSEDNVYDDLKSVVSNASEIAANLNRSSIYDNLDETLANAKAISEKLGRQKLYDDLDAAIADFRKTCDNVSTAAESIDMKGATARAEELLENLNDVAAKLRRGEGTLGRLTSDDKLYKEVEGLVKDVRQVIDNYRDTTPISTFTSLATGAF